MHNQSSSSEDSESIREEEQLEHEVSVGEDHRFDECREIGEKLSMDVGAVVGSGTLQEAEMDRVHEVEMGRASWRRNGLRDGQSCAHMVDVPVVVVDEQDVDGAGECDGLVLEGSNAEVVVSNGKNISWCFDKWDCGMMAMYAPCEVIGQADLWGRLVEVNSVLDVPLCCGGDFNVVLSPEECRHCVRDK
ncbi:hypothetical protein V6N13_041157 [Hibiscus sabdariffa]